MPIIVLLAELATLAWFVIFLVMVHGLLLPDTTAKGEDRDPIGGALVGSSRWAYFAGYGAFFLFSIAALLDNLFALGLGLQL